MPFLIGDTLEQREARIRQFLDDRERAIAILLAAADFERTVRRAIFHLSREEEAPTKKELADKGLTISRYPKAWRKFLTADSLRLGVTAKQVKAGVKNVDVVISDYSGLQSAFGVRNSIVHGVESGASEKEARKTVEVILAGTRAITEYAEKQGKPLTDRLKPGPRRGTRLRRKAEQPEH
jgi:hypothetical protein